MKKYVDKSEIFVPTKKASLKIALKDSLLKSLAYEKAQKTIIK